jgi:hypothetical protein
MALLAFKILLTPLLVGVASLGARRWGPMAGGWIVSLPLTSGPVVFLLALDRGTDFATTAAHASLAGCIAVAAYCLMYSRLAHRGWLVAMSLAATGWLAGAFVAEVSSSWLVPGTLALVVAATAAALRFFPTAIPSESNASAGWGDIFVRMAVGAMVVVTVTAIAPFVGPTVSGLLPMVPIVGTILAVFAQRTGGPQDGIGVQRGILAGLFGTAAFLAVVAWALTLWGIGSAFIGGIATVALVQVVSLRLFTPMRRASTAPATDAAHEHDALVRRLS